MSTNVDTPSLYRNVFLYEEDDGRSWQLRVEWDPEDFQTRIVIADQLVTSLKETAEPLSGGTSAYLSVDVDQTRWLIETLKAALARMESA